MTPKSFALLVLCVVQRYFVGKVSSGQYPYDDSDGRAVAYQDRVAQYLNHRLLRLVKRVIGRTVSP